MTVCITDERLIEVYKKTKSIRKTGYKLGMSHETARYKLKKLGVINKPIRYIWNDNYFSLDTPETFYWAGFIAADGCVKLHSNKYKQLSIGLAKKDHNHLEKFKKTINFNGPIHKIARKDGNSSEITISSAQLFDDLARFNIVPRKSLIYTFPEWLIEHSLVNHFMRGYNDGDGSFYTSKKKYRIDQLYFSLRGTKEFLSVFNSVLERNCKFKKHKEPRLNSGIYLLEFGGTRKVGKIRDFIYKNSTPEARLERKYNIAFDSQFINLPKDYKFKKVIGINMETGKSIQFDSMKAAEAQGFLRQGISACCRGVSNYHKGYIWRYT